MKQKKVLSIHVLNFAGTPYDFGVWQGKSINLNAYHFERTYQHINIDKATRLIDKFSSDYLKELIGLADGAAISQETAIQLFSGYDTVIPAMGCSTYAASSHYVRNYDFNDMLYDARFIFYKSSSGYASVGFSQQILGRLDGMNEKGLVIGLHFVNDNYAEEGFLATTICRLVLDQCATAEEAVKLIRKLPHKYCYNYSILDRYGTTVIVEASPDEQIAHYAESLQCTNHFNAETLQSWNKEKYEESLNRWQYLQAISKEKRSPIGDYHLFNDEASPLFYKHYEEFFGTLHTVVYCPKNLRVIIGVGGNCKPYEFSLQDWLTGKEALPKTIKGQIDR